MLLISTKAFNGTSTATLETGKRFALCPTSVSMQQLQLSGKIMATI